MLCNWYGNSNSGLSPLPSTVSKPPCKIIPCFWSKTSVSGKTKREHSTCMNTASQAESLRSFYLHVASMSSGPSLLKDLAALKWTAGSPLPTTLPKAWLEGRKDTQGHDYMSRSLLKGCVEQYGWFLTPCHIYTTDCFVKEGVAKDEERWVYAALLLHLERVGAFQKRGITPPKCLGEDAGWGRLQESHKQRYCCGREIWETLKAMGTLLAAGTNPQPNVRGDGKETFLGIQRVLGSQEVTSSC